MSISIFSRDLYGVTGPCPLSRFSWRTRQTGDWHRPLRKINWLSGHGLYRLVSTEPICPRPSFLTGVVGQSQPSVGQEGTNRIRWLVSKSRCPQSQFFWRTSFSRLTYLKKNGSVDTGLKLDLDPSILLTHKALGLYCGLQNKSSDWIWKKGDIYVRTSRSC